MKVSMIKYFKIKLCQLPEHLGTSASSPAPDHQIKVGPDSKEKYLPKKQAQGFHHTV